MRIVLIIFVIKELKNINFDKELKILILLKIYFCIYILV